MPTYLGQNFLVDSKLIAFISTTAAKLYEQYTCNTIVEIGPGKGAITKKLVTIPDSFFVAEKDETLRERLEAIISSSDILRGDILQQNLADVLVQQSLSPQQTLLLGNLPYYITSPILIKFFGQGEQIFPIGLFMLQKEVGDKIRHDAKKKSYLWRLLNYAYEVHYTKTVPAKAFRPAPKVQSCLVTLFPKKTLPSVSFTQLQQFLDVFAPYTRKTLRKIAKMQESHYLIPEGLAGKRLEELVWKDIDTIITSSTSHK